MFPETTPAGSTRLLLQFPVFVVVIVVAGCIGLTTVAWVYNRGPKAHGLIQSILQQYGALVPEITIDKGHASVKGPQPIYVERGRDNDVTIVIDTRDGYQDKALDYLRDYRQGVVLTRDAVVIKDQSQIRIMPLKDLPDVVLNQYTLQALADAYVPIAIKILGALLFSWLIMAKLVQIVLAALIPYGWASRSPVPFSYGQCLKLAGLCLIPPVLLDVMLLLFDIRLPFGWFGGCMVYGLVYLSVVVLATWGAIQGHGADTSAYRGFPDR